MAMGSDLYREQILDHYKRPRNYGELQDPTYTHTGENPVCGDEITIDVVLGDDEEVVQEVAFRGEGCAISQASASLLTQELPGMTIEEVRDLDRDDIVSLLGVDVSPMRIKCAVLAEKVIQDGAKIHFGEVTIERTTTE